MDAPKFLASTGGPAAFVIALPYAVSAGHAIVSGVCASCTAAAGGTDGLIELGLRSFRAIWPDLRVTEEGWA
jgi:hypothetical protein